MSAETILTTAFEVLKESGDVKINVDSRGLGMAYAIPQGEPGVVDNYGPWTDAEVKQVFYQQSSILGEVLAEIQLILSWRYSAAQQYIIEANLDKNAVISPGVQVDISVRFGQPSIYDNDLEAYCIPFHVEIKFKPLIGDTQIFNSKGQIRADGTGTFPPFQ
jgi:hypothetical protein